MYAVEYDAALIEAGRRIRQVQQEDGEDSISRYAESLNIPYSTYYYAQKGDRIDPDLLIQFHEMKKLSCHWILTGEGEKRAASKFLSLEKILHDARKMTADDRRVLAVALLEGEQRYESKADPEAVSWPFQGKRFARVYYRLGRSEKDGRTKVFGHSRSDSTSPIALITMQWMESASGQNCYCICGKRQVSISIT